MPRSCRRLEARTERRPARRTIDAHLAVSDDGQTFIDNDPETTLTFRADAQNNVTQVITPYKGGDGSIPPVTANRMAPGKPGLPPATPAAATPSS